MKADLHCHSRISDGSMEIKDIVLLAKQLGVEALSITDHDTVKELPEIEAACKENDIMYIPGIEISAYDYKRNQEAHILGYLMDRPEEVGEACKTILLQRQEACRSIVSTLEEAGYPITWELTSKYAALSTNTYKQHIMHALMELGYASSILGELYKTLFAKPQNGEPGGIAYRKIEYIDVFDAVGVIKRAGGVAVLAHPVAYKNMELISELAAAGLDGLEAWHPAHNEEAVAEIILQAKTYGLILTGGSDFHGMYEDKLNTIGSSFTTKEWVEKLFERKNS